MHGLLGNVAVVTGATGGIGRWIALGLARAGYHVVLVARSAERGAATQSWIASLVPGTSTELRLANLSLVRDTARIGAEIADVHPRIRLLVNNAGMYATRRQMTAEGLDAVLATNLLAPTLLMDTLAGALTAGAPARIVTAGSSTSDRARLRPGDLDPARAYGFFGADAYARSKLAVMMTTFTRAARLSGTGVVANVVHPGLVRTDIVRERGVVGVAWRLISLVSRTPEQGADTPLHVATASDWAGRTGCYVKDRRAVSPNPLALDAGLRAAIESETQALLHGAGAVPLAP